jgi:hypothetical protein
MCSETSLTGEPSFIVSAAAFPGLEHAPLGMKQTIDPLNQ